MFAVVLAVLGLLLILLPALRVRLASLRLGSRSIALSEPVDFTSSAPALLSVASGAACLVAALVAAGLPERLLTVPETTPTPIVEDAVGFVQAGEATGGTAIRVIAPDSMVADTIADSAGDFHVSVSAEATFGPSHSVSCLALRVSGSINERGESYRVAGSLEWPDTGYLFCVSHVGAWGFSRFDGGEPTMIRDFQESEAIRGAEPNVLAVSAEGDTFVLSINDVVVDTVQDARYPTGRAQIACGSPPEQLPAAVCQFEEISLTASP